LDDSVTVHHLREAETGEANVGTFELFNKFLSGFLFGVVAVVVLRAGAAFDTALRAGRLHFDRRGKLGSGWNGRFC